METTQEIAARALSAFYAHVTALNQWRSLIEASHGGFVRPRRKKKYKPFIDEQFMRAKSSASELVNALNLLKEAAK